jgi:hypothetical protein
MAASPEQKKNYQVVKDFKGMNTRPNRTALTDSEFSWLENAQPVGFGNIRIVANSANVACTWANTVTEIFSCNIKNVDYIVAFQQDGRAEYFNLSTLTKGNVASVGTFTGTNVRMRQWKNERAIIVDPKKGYFTWDAANLVSVGSLGAIAITNPGAGYVTPPAVTVSAPNEANGVQATVVASISNNAGTVQSVTVTAAGSGYTRGATVTIEPPKSPYGVQATASAILSANTVVAISVTNPGYGYNTAPNVTITANTGSGATATAVLGNGIVSGLTVTEAGSGYTSAPTITIDAAPAGGTNATAIASYITFKVGTIGAVLTSGGSGYTSAPTVTITPAPVGGTNAAATAVVFGGQVTAIIVTNPGAGYTSAPTITLSGGGATTNATAKGVLTEFDATDIASFQGRTWISQGRNVFYSAAGTYNDYISVSAGNIEITDDTLHSNITSLISANNFLYVFGDDSINVFSDVRVDTNGTTAFTNTNVSASTGSYYKDGIFPYFRSLLFINNYGIFALIGATVTKISDALDQVIPLIDFDYPVTGGQVLINNILSAAFNVYYKDPVDGTRPVQLVFFDKKWYVTSQGTINRVTPVATSQFLYLYGTNGTDLRKLYTDTNASISSTIQSALWPMQDTIRDKQALKFAIEATTNQGASFNITVDSETNTSPIYTLSNQVTWTNNAGSTVAWTDSLSATIIWTAGSGYSLYKSDAQQYGKYLGLTIKSSSPGFVLNTLEMEHELRARF